MFYFGEVPWHGLGTKLDKPATSKEAIKAAKLDWSVSKKQLYLPEGIPVRDTFATIRIDNPDNVLGVVGKSYTPLQNNEAFEFFDSIVGADKAIYHTAGTLLEGKIVWILAKLPGEIRLTSEDISHKYLLLSNSHDGSSAVQVKFTPVRVVCNNTLTLAFSDGKFHSVWHQKNVKKQLKDLPKLMGLVDSRYKEIEDSFKELLKVQMTDITLDKYLKNVFPDPRYKNNEQVYDYEHAKAKSNRQWAKYFFENGAGNDLATVKGSLWAALNGVTEFVDHRVTKQSQDRKVNSVWMGDGAKVKEKSFSVAMNMLE